jgi:translation initiation factor IF-2
MLIWIIRAIAGSILGNATATWFKKTKLGIWFYNKVDSIYKWAANKYNVKILTEEEKQMAKFPMLKKRLETIEKQLEELKK